MEKIKQALEVVDENLQAAEHKFDEFTEAHPDVVKAAVNTVDVASDVVLAAEGSRSAGTSLIYRLFSLLPTFKI